MYSKEQQAGRTKKQRSSGKPTKKKKRTLSDLKKELWFWTSLLVKLKWCDEDGYVYCIVRNSRHYYWKDGIQAGHFVRKSRGGVTKYCIHNIFPQCAASNLLEEQYEMGVAIERLYNEGKVPYSPRELLERNREHPYKEDREYLETTIMDYKKQVIQLSKEKNLFEWQEKCLKKYLNSSF